MDLFVKKFKSPEAQKAFGDKIVSDPIIKEDSTKKKKSLSYQKSLRKASKLSRRVGGFSLKKLRR